MLPAASFAVHVTVVAPIGNAGGALLDIVTCSTSVAVALPSDTVLSVRDVASTLMSFGEVIFGAVFPTRRSSDLALEMLPAASFAVHVTVVIPSGKSFGASFVSVICSTSVTVGTP